MTDNTHPCPAVRSCVTPAGRFVYGIHRPRFSTANLRRTDHIVPLGWTAEGRPVMNQVNFPSRDVHEPGADTIFEIANPFPFRGATFICRSWADPGAEDPGRIFIPAAQPVSLHDSMAPTAANRGETPLPIHTVVDRLPAALQLALAATSSDPRDLTLLAEISCRFHRDAATGRPTGLVYVNSDQGRLHPQITDPRLFEVVANNPHLPGDYKEAMVLRPGVQGGSEIVGEWRSGQSHVYEYLRRNSYIPWGHYAANMAHDAVRYAIADLTMDDITGMRQLYYQRTYLRLAEALGTAADPINRDLSAAGLENLRLALLAELAGSPTGRGRLAFNATLWGWNYGFDYAPSGYRLHASHQQIHQQFALVPRQMSIGGRDTSHTLPAYACGDLIQDFVRNYRLQTGADFFSCYQKALEGNQRMDGRRDRAASLVVYADAHVLLFVPKAQTSQWELQLMPTTPVGNILEADTRVRHALDRALFVAMQLLTAMGARLISVIEYSKRLDQGDSGQRLLYDFLPKMPESPGAFSEAQLRWINGHYPEDFAQACRLRLQDIHLPS